MFPNLSQRRREAEWMDEDDVDPALLADSLAFIRRVNWLFTSADAWWSAYLISTSSSASRLGPSIMTARVSPSR